MERAICKYRVESSRDWTHTQPLFFHGSPSTSQLNGEEARKNSRGRIDEYGFSNKTRGDRRRVTRLSRFHVAFYRRFNVESPLTAPTKERRSLEPFASFFFSRGTHSGGRRMVQMVGMVGVRHRLHAHQEKILWRAATQPRWTTLPGEGHQRGELHRRHVQQ